MKKIITLLVFIVTSSVYAQNSGITYQAVIYNPSTEILPGNNNPNVVLAEKNICLRFSIMDTNSSLEYQEVQKVKTDEFGMVNLIVGDGDQVIGYAVNFDAIIWNSSNKNLKVEIDTNGNCSNFIEISNQKFASVPFAFASKVAETVTGIVPIVNGGTGAATVAGAKTNLGLNNVDNTSDLNKPVSTATQTALDAKAPLASPGFTGIPTAPTAAAGTSTTQIATTAFVNAALATAASPDATATQKGRIQLAGDLGGTADAPTVPGLANKESAANKSTDTSLGNSDILFPTQKAVKTYVDNLVSSGVADATTSDKGKIQLAGDLAGTSSSAANPIISNDAISTVKIADGAVTTSKINDASVTETKLAANAVTSNKIVDGTIVSIDLATNSVTTDKITDASVTETKVAANAVTTVKIIDGAVTTSKIADNTVTNAKLGETITVANGGTGATSLTGYLKGNGTTAFTSVSTIPVADVTGAVRSVNGVLPDNTTGNVSVLIGNVYTGSTITPTTGTTPVRSDIYIVSGQSGSTNDNGRTFIYDGSTWHEISTNIAALDNTFVKLSGSTMVGNLVFPAGKKIILNDAPTIASDAANKDYVDTKTGGSGTINFVPKFSAAKTLTDSSIFDNGTNVGIGNASPANKLEITQGTAGNSGLRFTDLTASSSATTASSKVLGVNNNGDVILTNIPGTQNIVTFSTATPTTSGVVFTPNTQNDQSVIYQSAVDNSMWTSNGSAYATYTPPSTTAWNLAGTTNDAGSNKASSIWRSGGITAGGTSTTPRYGNLTAVGGTNFTGVPAYGTASIGLISNSIPGWSGSGFLFSNSTAGSNAFSMVYNADRAFFAQLTPTNTVTQLGNWGLGGLSIGSGNAALSRLDVFGGLAVGSYAGTNAAPANGLIVSGNLGVGTSSPTTRLQVNSAIAATNTVNVEGIFRLQRPQAGGIKWENIAQFNLGSYAVTTGGSTNATSRLDLAMNDGDGVGTNNVMTWQANGNVGFSTTAPLSLLSNASAGTNFVSSNSATQSATGISWLTNNAGYNTSLYNANNVVGSNGLQVKVANTSSQTIVFEVGQNSSQSGISNPYFNVLGNGNVGIGTNAPLTRLIVNDNTYIANLPSSSTNLMDNSTFRPLTRFQTSSGGNNNAISHYLTTTAAATQAHNYSIGTSLPYVLQPAGGNVGIGITAPSAQLHTTGSVRFAGAGTPAANRVLTSDASGNATWQSAPGTTSVRTC